MAAGTDEPCPRCGTPRAADAPCPACGYEPRHPGVLGAYVRAARLVAKRPALSLAFLIPVALQVATEVWLQAFDAANGVTTTLPSALAGVAAVFLQVWWFFVAVALTTRMLHGDAGRPTGITGGMLRDSAVGAAVALVPLVLIAGLVVAGITGAAGALALLAIIVLAIAAVVWSGRVVGIPVEAALHDAGPGATVRNGMARGRDNGGLGLVFLAFLLLAAVSLVPVAFTLAGVDLAPLTTIVMGALLAWPIGVWSGVAMALGLAPRAQEEAAFTCPHCGDEAHAQAGRAQCSCGLEGPFYSA